MKRQSDEEVNKRIKQKYIFQQICPVFRFENKPSSGAKRKIKIKPKVRYKKTPTHSFPQRVPRAFRVATCVKSKVGQRFSLESWVGISCMGTYIVPLLPNKLITSLLLLGSLLP